MNYTLHALSYSPWSEKARWALQHHKLAFIEKEHSPLFGEALLRWRTWLKQRPLTVPILQTPERAIQDSYQIARFADQVGQGATLISDEAAVEPWNALSDKLMCHGRALLLHRLEQHPAAVVESMPRLIPSLLHKPMRPMFQQVGLWFFRSKYQISADQSQHQQAMIEGLERFQQHMADHRETVLDQFSFADIAMACVLQMIQPVADAFLSIGPATRKAWTDPSLAAHFSDLITWRDALYRAYR